MGSVVVARRLSCPAARGFLVPRPGIEPVSSALEGRILTTGPPGKSLSEKFFISPSILNDNLAGWSILGCRFFTFSSLSISCHYVLVFKFSSEKSADSLMGVPLYMVFCVFPLLFLIFFLCI